jgi:putative protease
LIWYARSDYRRNNYRLVFTGLFGQTTLWVARLGFGGPLFNARASASNFDREGLKEAIHYAKLRNVKINFTLNTLLKDDEFDDAVDLAKYVYSLGVDAIIVQDLGLAKYLIENFPDMAVHASTQMTAHNLQGVLALQNLGFKRVVLSREVALSEIEYICSHSKVEIETFIHGALCISYSGQCLISSAIGGRSGNRGRCAQACRLPYELLRNNESIDKGYLLSPKDLCGLKFIPDLIKAGVNCFKIEGRMKPPEYVATVTRIYRKYINLALSDEPYEIDDYDFKQLMLAFNRGGFSDGNFNDEPNTQYVYKPGTTAPLTKVSLAVILIVNAVYLVLIFLKFITIILFFIFVYH